MRVREVLSNLSQRCPNEAAENWDNVGLLLGDPELETSGVLVAIDLTLEAIQIAIKNQFRLILNHHPCIFPQSKGLSRVLAGSAVYEAIRHGISVVACHTNFDRCALEVIDLLSQRFSQSQSSSFVVQGRLFDSESEKGLGYGFWGEFQKPETFAAFAESLKEIFEVKSFLVNHPQPEFVKKVAFAAGKGTSFLQYARKQACDVYVTGEVGYHATLGALKEGLCVIELGHRESEKFFIDVMTNWMTELGLQVAKIQSPIQTIYTGGIQ